MTGDHHGPQVASTAGALLHHHPDLLRERRAPPGPRLHHRRGRRAGPPHAPARRGGLLPHGHRRARRARGAGRGGAGRDAARAGRQERRAVQDGGRAGQRHQRLLHPHQRPRARRGGQVGRRADQGERLRLQGPLRGLVLPPLRGLQDRERDPGGQPLPDPPDRARPPARGELVLQAVGVPGAARGAVRRAPGLRGPGCALQRGAVLHQGRAARLLAVALAHQLGRAHPVGRRAGGLRLGGRAPELLLGVVLRARGPRT